MDFDITIYSVFKYTVIFIIFAAIMISNLYAGYFIDNPFREKGIGQCYKKPRDYYIGLDDILHFHNDKISNISETIANSGFISCVLLMFISYLPFNIRNTKILILYLILIGLGYIIRVLSFSFTVPPPPHQQYHSDIKWYEIFKIIWNETDTTAPLSDFMFSGHAFFIVLSLLFLWKYKSFSWINGLIPNIYTIILIIFTIYGIISVPCISMSGLHYTGDVVIGVSIAILFFLARYSFIPDINYKNLV